MGNQIFVWKSMCHQSSRKRREKIRKRRRKIMIRKWLSLTTKSSRSHRNLPAIQWEGILRMMPIEINSSTTILGMFSVSSSSSLIWMPTIKDSIIHTFGWCLISWIVPLSKLCSSVKRKIQRRLEFYGWRICMEKYSVNLIQKLTMEL